MRTTQESGSRIAIMTLSEIRNLQKETTTKFLQIEPLDKPENGIYQAADDFLVEIVG